MKLRAKILLMKTITLLILTLATLGCGINALPTLDEKVTSSLTQVDNQYKRRADLVPNLVNTVKGFAKQEKETLLAVTRARSKVMQLSPESLGTLDPAALQEYQSAQGELGSALSRLMVVVESYPELKSNQNFLSLQSQLEGTENRLAVARRDYINAVEKYNIEIRTIPGRWWRDLLYPEMKTRDIPPMISQSERSIPVVEFN